MSSNFSAVAFPIAEPIPGKRTERFVSGPVVLIEDKNFPSPYSTTKTRRDSLSSSGIQFPFLILQPGHLQQVAHNVGDNHTCRPEG
jgi:hypothetical protein